MFVILVVFVSIAIFVNIVSLVASVTFVNLVTIANIVETVIIVRIFVPPQKRRHADVDTRNYGTNDSSGTNGINEKRGRSQPPPLCLHIVMITGRG